MIPPLPTPSAPEPFKRPVFSLVTPADFRRSFEWARTWQSPFERKVRESERAVAVVRSVP